MNIGVAFLTTTPSNSLIDFASKIALETRYKVFIIVDNEEYNQKLNFGIEVVNIKSEDCKNKNYVNFATIKDKTSLQKTPNAWDKMAYYFCEINRLDFVWVLEDDVFTPSVNTLIQLTIKYCDYDLVTANNFHKKDNVLDWHWLETKNFFNPPYYYSMVCGCGISKRVFSHLKSFVSEHKQLFYHEISLNTLAMQKGLKVTDAKELKSIVWMGDWGLKQFILLPNNLFHPLKTNHSELRKEIEFAKANKYTPKNDLPDFLK